MKVLISAAGESLRAVSDRIISGLSNEQAPAWFSAIGTVGAFWVAVLILRHELQERKKHRQDERHAAARKVSVWIQSTRPKRELRVGGFYETGGGHFIVVRNLGEEPIYNANVFVGAMGDNLLDELDDSSSSSVYTHVFYVVPPGEDCTKKDPLITVPERTLIGLEFTDANGVSWWREGGTLREILKRRPWDF